MAGERNGSARQGPSEAPPRVSIGDVLRSERERRALSLDDIAANLRIRRALLDAIEEGRFKELPGAPYATGFVKAYAEFLELDRDEIIRRFKEEAAGLDSHKELNFPRPLSESRLPGGILLLLSAVIAASAYAIWYFQGSGDRTELPRVAAVPERLAPLADPAPASPEPETQPTEGTRPEPGSSPASVPPSPGEVAPAAAPPAPPAPAVTVDPPPAVTASPPRAPESDTEAAAPATPAAAPATPAEAAAAPSAPPANVPASTAAPAVAAAPSDAAEIPAAPTEVSAYPRAYGEENPSRIVIRATADSWIQVRDPSGTVVFTRVLRAGDSYNVPNRQDLFLYTGSAGALEISVDGTIAPSLGQFGAVRRDVMLDPDRLAAGTAVLDQRRPSSNDPGTRSNGAGPGQASSIGSSAVSRQ